MRPYGLKTSLVSLLSLFPLLTAACAHGEAVSSPPPAPTPEMNKVAAAEQQFALDLYAAMTEERDGENLFFSPHSVYSVMAMAAEGAKGETAEQMAKALGLEASDDSTSPFASSHKGLAGLNLGLRGRGGKDSHTLLSASAVWVDKSYPLAPSYQAALHPYFSGGGGVFACDFHNRYDAEAKRVDQWCDDNTRGHISGIMPKLTSAEAKALHMVLTNAVYFEGKWVDPFKPDNTAKEPFHLAGGKDAPTDMMRTWNFGAGRYGAVDAEGEWFATPTTFNPDRPLAEQNLYPEGKGFTMAELPYKGDRLSMLLIAPREPGGLPHVEKLLSAERLAGWVAKMESRNISHLRLPKLDLATTYDMTADLSGLGMELPFTPDADFSRMVDSSDPNLKLFLAMVIHKATLKVDEQGTVAAAVTGTFLPPAAAIEPETTLPFHPEFHADRPFMMLIRDKETGDILFMGRINDPRNESSAG